MTPTRRDYPRCTSCRRRFGGWEAMRVAHTTRGRCKTVRELRRNRLHRRGDGVWVQAHQSRSYRQLRLFRLGRPTPLKDLGSATSTQGGRESGTRGRGTTNAGWFQVPLPFTIGEAA